MSSAKKRKLALVLHGFPGLSQNDPIRKYISRPSFDAIIPDLFDGDCEFNIECLSEHFDKLLNGRKPDLIIAASLGGLIAPYIALKYPDAKLVMIATGPRIDIGIPFYNLVIKKTGPRAIQSLTQIAQRVPAGIYRTFYKVFNPHKSISGSYERYEENINETFQNFKKIPLTKTAELLRFVNMTDNRDVLEKLKNITLIMTGGNDVMMPPRLSLELKNLIKNSILLENKDRLHYQVFDERDFVKVDEFLK